MSETVDRLKEFVNYVDLLKGDEKGEAQVFADRLFKAFGHAGYKEAGAELEYRVKKGGRGTSFADLFWKNRVLLEMKKRGEKLQTHYRQAFDYWLNAVPNRPQYVVLCNFDEFWIYDLNRQIDAPVDIVATRDLPKRYPSLNFLFADDPKPLFGMDREAVSRKAAAHVASVFSSLVSRGEPRERAQRFVLQAVVAMFAEDIDLLPAGLIQQIINDVKNGASSYDLFGGLFRQMNTEKPASAGRFKGVRYFNGGLYAALDLMELTPPELNHLELAVAEDWGQVNPAIFGTLFQGSMDEGARHTQGAHFTSEADILRVITPTIVKPWQDLIANATTMKELLTLRANLLKFRVLDPACGSGNFLYVSFRSLVRLEIDILAKIASIVTPKEFSKAVKTLSLISPRQFFGIDVDSFGIELAKVTLMLAKKLAFDDAVSAFDRDQVELDLHNDHVLPLDNLDTNFQCADALFAVWPEVDTIVSNPPFQSKNKMQDEFGRAYLNRLRTKYSDVPGRADYCVYWFRRSHDHLKEGQRAGLVGTNTIRQNYSRDGSLGYIVNHNGTITEAVSTQVWSGDAVVHVSIANWIKGPKQGKKRLFRQVGDSIDSPWEMKEVQTIDAALSFNSTDVTDVSRLEVSAATGGCYQGQTHGHKGFLLTRDEAEALIDTQPSYSEVLFPFLTADELLGQVDGRPTRYVIDFGERDLLESQSFGAIFERVKTLVLSDRQAAADEEDERNKVALAEDSAARTNRHHTNFLSRWWSLSYPRRDLMSSLELIPRYICCGQVTKRPVFAFISSAIHPNAALMVFPFADDYSFGVMQSSIHWAWFINRCSTLKGDYRYTSNTVFDTFAWPQNPTKAAVRHVADCAVALRELRSELQAKHKLSLRELYRSLDLPGAHPLKDIHQQLDAAVRDAYGMSQTKDPLIFLVELNQEVAKLEKAGLSVSGPGLPKNIGDVSDYITTDCISMK